MTALLVAAMVTLESVASLTTVLLVAATVTRANVANRMTVLLVAATVTLENAANLTTGSADESWPGAATATPESGATRTTV